MKQPFKFLTTALLVSALTSCGSSDSPFTQGGSSSSNIISSANFGVTATDLSPDVLQFAAGSITNPGALTANASDLLFSFSPVESEITVTAADNEGALVNSGTIFFSTQYGILSASSCELVNGRCSVTWQSVAELSQLSVLNQPTLIDIRNVVTVWTYGAEGFTDLDGDSRLSDSEVFFDTESPYLDRNDNNTYDATIDNVLGTSVQEAANTLYDGPSCDASTRADCGTSSLVPIFESVYLRLNFDSSSVTAFNVVINTPADNSTFLFGATINFTATATDPEDSAIIGFDDPLPGNNLAWDSDLDGGIAANGNDINVSNLSLGSHVITARASDSDGNVTTATVNVTITAAPVVTINTPTDPTTITAGDIVSFTATATDNEDGTITGTDAPVAGDDIVWSTNNPNGVFGISSSNNANVDTTGWTVGVHTITVTVTDSDGNTATDTMTLTVN